MHPSAMRFATCALVALLLVALPPSRADEIGDNDVRVSDLGPNGDPAYDARQAAVAYKPSGGSYLVVWEGDDSAFGLSDEELEIFGQLLSAVGGELGNNDVRISFAGGTGDPDFDATYPAVACNTADDEYLVVWSQDTDAGDLVDEEFEIWGQLVDSFLFPIGGNFRISTMGPDGSGLYDALQPAVVYNPDENAYLVVWSGDDDSGGLVNDEFEIWAQRIDASGTLIGGNLRISDLGGTGDFHFAAAVPDVVYNTQELVYLIVWGGDDNVGGLVDGEYEVFGQLMDAAGAGVGPNDFRISDMGGVGSSTYGGSVPAAAYNPNANEYLVVWQGDDNVGGLVDNEFEVFSQRMAADLTGLGPNDHRLSDVGGVGDAAYDVLSPPDVAFNAIDDEYLVVWAADDPVDGIVDNEREIFAQRLTWDIQGVGPNDERISDVGGLGDTAFLADDPVVAAHGALGDFLVAWTGDDDTGTLVDDEGEAFIQRLSGSYVFVDDFESGDADRWSSTVP